MDVQGVSLAANQFVDARNGVRYAYRTFGSPKDAIPPLLLMQRFRGSMDDWDPLLIETLAKRRQVMPFDNAGIGYTTGTVPRNITAMARDAIDFFDAMHLKEIDLLGYSIGGMIAQEVALLRPRLVRKLILAATGPQGGGEEMHGWPPDVENVVQREHNDAKDALWLFFNPTPDSIQRGKEYLMRVASQKGDHDSPVARNAYMAQYDAVVEWGIPDKSKLHRLAGIRQPTLITTGDNDTMIPPVNSHILAEHIPDARERIFPDAGHGFLYQWPMEFAQLVDEFLG